MQPNHSGPQLKPVRAMARPWIENFDDLVKLARKRLYVVSPYVTTWGVEQLLRNLGESTVDVTVITDLSPQVLLQSSEPRAFLLMRDRIPAFQLRHLTGLHAKVYVADDQAAIVTSANLTRGGLQTNRECGVLVTEPVGVAAICSTVLEYLELSVPADLEAIDAYVVELGNSSVRHSRIKVPPAAERLFMATVKQNPAASKAGTGLRLAFRPTILGALQSKGPLAVGQLYEVIREAHGEVCDDRITRGKPARPLWRHEVRFALQEGKEEGLLELQAGSGAKGGRWALR